ncbi:hypothetical protein COT95_01580 [Candidatus Falkowbacteria bacterium CG10_big_fil_rev_8_21_14_0_10_37_6]|uniref:Uncharacterized protein n=1 Tax=Candidatus Falkowbacteria bacterium CG10_big_fil_rev_8_21_14_0_10_37_6 TaxID=1974563 RepID=A0A2H0V752_9BACT|nr:MAG: hypothetical protein COT95_01580 [Candidatus Falkowbacteria bacterium CG10_big_fil_rev_8_21_14_0_10_37_6]
MQNRQGNSGKERKMLCRYCNRSLSPTDNLELENSVLMVCGRERCRLKRLKCLLSKPFIEQLFSVDVNVVQTVDAAKKFFSVVRKRMFNYIKNHDFMDDEFVANISYLIQLLLVVSHFANIRKVVVNLHKELPPLIWEKIAA